MTHRSQPTRVQLKESTLKFTHQARTGGQAVRIRKKLTPARKIDVEVRGSSRKKRAGG